jgi:hypothetical protein
MPMMILWRVARQQTDKHHVTIGLRMLFPVTRQREAPMKSLSGNNVAGYLAMTPAQQYGERLFSMRSVPRLYNPS